MKPRSPWDVAGHIHIPDELLAGSLSGFLAGERTVERLFAPGPRCSLEEFFWSGDRLVLSILDDLVPRFTLLTPQESGWPGRSLDALPSTGVVSLRTLDAEAEDSDGHAGDERRKTPSPRRA